ncbi:34919_t:CDS:1, partial [Racocetra persica]
SSLSSLHYFLMYYCYDGIERDLKKDLFRQFLRANYPQGSVVAPGLITQFSKDLDTIAEHIWYIPNRLIFMLVAISYHLLFDFNFGNKDKKTINWVFLLILFPIFALLITGQLLLFPRAAKMGLTAKKRTEKDNEMIFERINNLEHIKAVAGENYEEEKVARCLDTTFRRNVKTLLYTTAFRIVPEYIISPNIPIVFISAALYVGPLFLKEGRKNEAFVAVNIARYYFTTQKLNSEVNKLTYSLNNLEELASSLLMVKKSVSVLNRPDPLALPVSATYFWENGDISFDQVVFAYPQRPQHTILHNFSFVFQQGKSYGIAGKNGIGKSTITKTFLKLYNLQSGKILVGERNIQEIDTESLRRHICYQTNHLAYFQASIAENVYHPYQYDKKDPTVLENLTTAAKKAGVYDFIAKLPAGFDTTLKGGNDLSEGQKQLIATMKIFLRDYDVYILDEILSNVHPVLKKTILRNIFEHIKGKTVIVIDHHYEIFQYLDHVYQFTGEKLLVKKKQDFS